MILFSYSSQRRKKMNQKKKNRNDPILYIYSYMSCIVVELASIYIYPHDSNNIYIQSASKNAKWWRRIRLKGASHAHSMQTGTDRRMAWVVPHAMVSQRMEAACWMRRRPSWHARTLARTDTAFNVFSLSFVTIIIIVKYVSGGLSLSSHWILHAIHDFSCRQAVIRFP